MPEAAVLKPKKQPVQGRARATVEALLQAAAYILIEQGFARFTTNRVAERAGVNIASLYQYFPNKEALITELHRRHVEELRAATRTVIGDAANATPEQSLRAIIDATIAAHAVNPELHRIFAEEMPRFSAGRLALPDAGPVLDAIGDLLQRFGHDAKEARRRAWFVRTVLNGIVHQAVAECPERLASGEMAEEIEVILGRYILTE